MSDTLCLYQPRPQKSTKASVVASRGPGKEPRLAETLKWPRLPTIKEDHSVCPKVDKSIYESIGSMANCFQNTSSCCTWLSVLSRP
ncbi:hypothetical protein GCK72_005596 [Caenorhabditis remanei]|uniref:Uncharacterized protein n=1 Tax=Caenorhabditis remanei TaxID=31234 RepID=A0A6A5HGZ4_CAERE|nr:hypothetical protein GCK72_005596 [Caenorhabditis remanei]KAF1765643.1 hypothetical protein GCK72_005596 [Caenorhabditis remanei]